MKVKMSTGSKSLNKLYEKTTNKIIFLELLVYLGIELGKLESNRFIASDTIKISNLVYYILESLNFFDYTEEEKDKLIKIIEYSTNDKTKLIGANLFNKLLLDKRVGDSRLYDTTLNDFMDNVRKYIYFVTISNQDSFFENILPIHYVKQVPTD